MNQSFFESSNEVSQLFRLDERIALITGAGGHLGQSMVNALCEVGCHVILNGRNKDELESLAHHLSLQGQRVSVQAFDITQEHLIEENIRIIDNQYNRLDIIVNNAYAGKAGTIETSEWEDFDKAYNICVTSSFKLIQSAKSLLEKSAQKTLGGSSIINIASMYGMVSPDPSIYGDSGANNPPYYGSAKGGLIQLTRYLACHLAHLKIRVNSISPGAFPPLEIKDTNPSFHQQLCNKNPMKRIGNSDELKGALFFLASDASSYVTGINLPVDGGWTAW